MATPEDNVDKGLFEQDPHVDQLRPEPSAPPSDVVILEGLAGKSDREGWARLYFNRTLTYYAEFRREDIAFTQAIPPNQPPMVGLKATRVGIKKDAVIEYTRTTRARAADEFDLDVQLAGAGLGTGPFQPNTFNCQQAGWTWLPDCQGPTWWGSCRGETCQHTICVGGTCVNFCETKSDTCDTCQTQCNQGTCNTCNTCQTHCNQNTCNTCNTCQTQCGQATCQTCNTCHTG